MSFISALKETASVVVDATVDKMREIAVDVQRSEALSTGAHQFQRRGAEDRGGPPKIESGYYSTGRMVGFGSDGSSSGDDDRQSSQRKSKREPEWLKSFTEPTNRTEKYCGVFDLYGQSIAGLGRSRVSFETTRSQINLDPVQARISTF